MRYHVTRAPFADNAAGRRHRPTRTFRRSPVAAILFCLLCFFMSPTRIAHADGLPQDVAAESEEALETSSEEQTTDPTEDETTVIDATTGEATADETPIATDEPPTQEEPLETHEPSSSSSGSLPADVAESSDTPSAEAASAATQPPHRLAPYLLMGGGSAALTLIGIATVLERRRDGAGRKPYRRRRHYA